MELTINGNITINGNVTVNEKGNGLLDNEASFNELMSYLKERAGEGCPAVRAQRRPGYRQLREDHEVIARITVGEAVCEVFENGYGIFDNGDRRTVVWLPDCPKAARVYYPNSKKRMGKRTQLMEDEADWDTEEEWSNEPEEGEDRLTEEELAEMAWYLAVILAGENQIEANLNRPQSKKSNNDDASKDSKRYVWYCGARFTDPEEYVLRKEEEEERLAMLSEKQREVYRLYYEEEYTQEEIAKMLGISHQAVSKQLKYVRKEFSEFFQRRLQKGF